MSQLSTVGNLALTNQSSAPAKNVAIVGVNRIAAMIYRHPERVNLSPGHIVGFVNIEPAEVLANGQASPELLGNLAELSDVVKRHEIEKLILAIDPSDFNSLHTVIQKCEQASVDYEVLSSDYDIEVDDATEEPAVIDQAPPPPAYWLQRPLDIIISTIMFLVFAPSYAVIALAIKLESRGTVLYSQERMGLNGRVFRIYKFRSMYSDAEKMGPQLASKRDPRITRVGLFLRRTRLDELPQLLNIIKGDMSLVGPRPERPYFVDKYAAEIPRYRERLKVKPGLTGFAQVETGYDESLEDVKEKLRHDLYYIERRNSARLYWQIMFKTIWVVLTAQGQ